jgi:hypothetical protein
LQIGNMKLSRRATQATMKSHSNWLFSQTKRVFSENQKHEEGAIRRWGWVMHLRRELVRDFSLESLT